MLVRGHKGVEPTIYGLTVLRRAKIILNEVARSIEEVKALEQGRIGEITFGITQNYATYMVPPILAAIHAECPDLKVTVVADGFVELLARIKNEAIDFGLWPDRRDPSQRWGDDRAVAHASIPRLCQFQPSACVG